MTKPFNRLCAGADMRPGDTFFARERSDRRWLELQKSPPVPSWTSATVGGLLLIAFMISAFWAAAAWVQLLAGTN